MYWLSLRGLSFSVDFIRGAESKDRWFPSFWKSLGYFFYLPPMHLGPVMLYNDFVAQVHALQSPFVSVLPTLHHRSSFPIIVRME